MSKASKKISYEKPDLINLERLIQSPALRKQEKESLKSYKEKIDNETNEVKIEYSYDKFGRYLGYATKGKSKTYTTGTSMKRIIRNLLFGETYDDLDIANASGEVMCQLFNRHGLNTEKMSYLNKNRKEVLEMIMDYHPSFKIERDTAKEILIEIFFCGSGHTSQYKELSAFTESDKIMTYDLPPFVEELKKEYAYNLDYIVKKREYQDMINYIIKKKGEEEKDPWIGNFASLLYQDEERKILDVIVSEVSKIGKRLNINNSTGSLIFDGLHIKKEVSIKDYIRRIEDAILEQTNYNLKLEIKDMIVKKEEQLKYLGDKPVEITYEAKKAKFELACFKTRKGKLPFHTQEVVDGIIDIYSQTKSDFNISYEDWIGGPEFLKDWFVDSNKRAYDDIEYSCVKDEDKKDNIFYSFPTLRFKTLVSNSDPEQKQKNISFFEDYLLLLVEDNPRYVEWLRLWLADILINPDNKGSQPVAIILYGQQGSGKTTIRCLQQKCLGDKLVHHTSDPSVNGEVMNDFNKTLLNKIFIEYEELNMRIHSALSEKLKALITDKLHNITKKREDTITVKASERHLATTNNAMSAVIEKGDRRYVAFRVSNRRVNDTKYWDSFYKNLDNDSFIKDICDYLCSFKEKVSLYAFRDSRPITEYYKSLQQMSILPHLDFLRDTFFYNKDQVKEFLRNELYTIPSSTLCDLYNTWREMNQYKEKITSKSFTMHLKSLEVSYGISHQSKSSSNVFVIDFNKLRESLIRDFNITDDKPKKLLEPETSQDSSSKCRIVNPHKKNESLDDEKKESCSASFSYRKED
jgi:hypothetical protein